MLLLDQLPHTKTRECVVSKPSFTVTHTHTQYCRRFVTGSSQSYRLSTAVRPGKTYRHIRISAAACHHLSPHEPGVFRVFPSEWRSHGHTERTINAMLAFSINQSVGFPSFPSPWPPNPRPGPSDRGRARSPFDPEQHIATTWETPSPFPPSPQTMGILCHGPLILFCVTLPCIIGRMWKGWEGLSMRVLLNNHLDILNCNGNQHRRHATFRVVPPCVSQHFSDFFQRWRTQRSKLDNV